MRSFDELMACEYVIDWTPQEMAGFVRKIASEMGNLKQSYAREKLAQSFMDLQTDVLKAMESKSMEELQAVREYAQAELNRALNGEYDYEPE